MKLQPISLVRLALIGAILALLLITASDGAVHAQGVTFTVNSTADAADNNPGDGLCDPGTGNCTLRAAIMEANALAGADTITLPAGNYTLAIAGISEDAATTGDLDITDDLTINGPGAVGTIIDGGGLDRVFHILSGSQSDISGVTIRNGSSAGIWNSGTLTLTDTNVVSNSGGKGGGIANSLTGSPPPETPLPILNLTNSAISGNTAAGEGGGIFNDGELNLTNSAISGNTAAGEGGGIISATDAGTITLTNSTISGNTASLGGGIMNQVPLILTNSTVSGNTATNVGGGIWSNGSVTLISSTVSGNTAGTTGGGINNLGTVTLTNTIIANFPNSDCAGGGFTSFGHNLDGDGTCNLTQPTDLPSSGPLLDPLKDNGGPTFTHALLVGSPAIDAGSCTDIGGNVVTTDQRGVVRPQGAACDIGAFEAEPPGATPIPSTTTWGLIGMGGLAFAVLVWRLRRVGARERSAD